MLAPALSRAGAPLRALGSSLQAAAALLADSCVLLSILALAALLLMRATTRRQLTEPWTRVVVSSCGAAAVLQRQTWAESKLSR